MICAISLHDRSSGPRTGTSPLPLHEGSSSNFAATAAISRVAHVGAFRSPDIGEKNIPWFLIGSTWRRKLSINEGIVSARKATPVLAIRSSIATDADTSPAGLGHPRPRAETATTRFTPRLLNALHAGLTKSAYRVSKLFVLKAAGTTEN